MGVAASSEGLELKTRQLPREDGIARAQKLMEASPLTRQPQPEVFTPKIVELYHSLFESDPSDADVAKSDGFWKEFFLLKPDRNALQNMLSELSPSETLAREERTRELFARANEALEHGKGFSAEHALDTLSVFLACAMAKRYAHPSSDIITVLAGLDRVDAVFTKFVGILDGIIRSSLTLEIRHKAIEVILAVTSGAHQTTLLTYMVQRDLFPAIAKFVSDSELPGQILEPFALLGLLANYNKFEFQNPYQLRLGDFVNEPTIRKIIRCVGYTCQALRNDYVAVQDDIPEGWSFSLTLNMIGLGFFVPGPKPDRKPVYDAETARQMFSSLPASNAAVLLPTYDFVHMNKLFAVHFVSQQAEDNQEQPIASYISLTSYLLQHAHLSTRATNYAHLNLMVFRLLVEDPVVCKRLSADSAKTPVRLCRHRQPFLPLIKGERILATAVLDIMIDGINHNLRKRLDVSLYTLCLGILLRIISYLSRSRTRLQYHWSEFFRSLLSIVRFLTTYSTDLQDLPHMETLLDHVVNLIALSLSSGEAFLPSPAAYDDLFYKVVESADVLQRFKQKYLLGNRKTNSIDTLISVNTHYTQLLTDNVDSGRKTANLTTQQVSDIIKQGYETLSIQAKEGLDSWDRYREADERTLLKKMARGVVGDVRVMAER